MTRKIAPILAGIALAGGLAFGGASLASAQDSTDHHRALDRGRPTRRRRHRPPRRRPPLTAPSGRRDGRDGNCPDKAADGSSSSDSSSDSSASSAES